MAGSAQKSSKTHSPELPYLEKPYALEPFSYTPQEQHLRPPEPDVFDTRDLRGRASGSLQGSSESGGQDVTMVAETQPSPMIAKLHKAAERASSLPDIITSRNPPPSSFFRDSPLTPVANVRDSVSTQKSNTSSSVYPFSVSSASGPTSPISPTSLRPLSEDIEHFEISPMEPEVEDGISGFDPDDVSYRLRLLVKNNYFLPPAHSKPILSDLSPAEPKKSTRAATPTFLDIFNKLKSKPLSPVVGTGFESNPPILRTTGDAITAPHTPQSRSSMQASRPMGSPNGIGPGRVVVVREKMEDLIVAAKQAEQEMKTRGVRRDVEPPSVQVFDDIDPTDAVDVPPPPSSYPFPMQTSTLHGLGVDESIGAAVLAERLPPGSPMSSIEPAEDDWRRSLLQAAVHHSLENTADLSSYSQALELSTPAGSPSPTYPRVVEVEASPTPDPRHRLGQRILQQPFSDSSESFRDEDKKETGKAVSNRSLTACTTEYLSADSRLSSRPSSYFLARVETPTDPWTALTPPPPRKQFTPFVSQSQTDLTTSPTTDPTERPCRTPTPTLRRTVSTPMLSANRITPPPLPTPGVYMQDPSHDQTGSHNTSREAERSQSTVTDSMYSDDDVVDRSRRASAALSALMSRPSLSDYSQDSLSPTTSAFQEDLNSAYSPLVMTFQAAQQAKMNRASPVPRDSTMSPPPRISSSLAHVALPPPPRGSSLRYPPLPVTSHFQLDTKASLDSVINEFVVPAPTTRSIPLPERREDPPRAPLTENNVETTLHTAPEPSSPTSFFDSIQSQPNALDDLDSSSDESDIMHATSFVDGRSRTMSNVATPPLMRLGNHSSPHMSRTTRSAEERRVPLPFGVQDPKQPIANVPHHKPFFVQQLSEKSDQGHGAPVSPFDFYQYSRQHASGASIDANVPKSKRPSLEMTTRTDSVDESLRRLDGLLQQHMVTEKDTIRRIAKTLQSSNTQRTPAPER